ncbi:MYCBP-associated protein [Halictus rubicundus]|uniref:MYCBP-associated protein n=1 Tax=Halictus rubicundus TaxID=77578 RepID=UPI004036E7EB
MDYARKIGKTDEPKKWTRQNPSILNLSDKAFAPVENFAEDHPLVNWKRWLANRRKHHKHIASSTGRRQTDQTLNACETVRPLIEMRELMDHANVLEPVLSTNVREVPKFWRLPPALPDHGDPCLPTVTVTQTKRDSNEPELTYVDLPELIEKEKDLVCLKSKTPLWRRSQYLMKRKCQLSEEIDSLVPKEPETRHLIVKGHGFAKPQKHVRPRRVPVITLSDALLEKDEEEDTCRPEELQDQAIVLRIEDREIAWEKCAFELGQTDPIVWNVSFSSRMNERAEKEIELENKGNRVILYQWRDAVSLPATLPLKRRVSAFFFNKTKGVILPGQIVALKFWYLPRLCGVSSEVWRFQTDPVLCPSPLMFRLSGCAETASDRQLNDGGRCIDVDKYLDDCIRDSTIRETITEIFENMDSVALPEPFYGTLFLESEVFLAKNPLCFYRPSLITEFHKLYYSATNQTELRWNLCVEHLRETLLRIAHPESRQAMLLQFSQLYKECLKPTLSVSEKYTKHKMVYNLLCSFFNRFEQESEHARGAALAKEPKEVSVKVSELVNLRSSTSTSQVTVKSSNSRNKRGRRSISRLQSSLVQDTVRNTYLQSDDKVYKEVFFIRVHELLGTMMKQVAATIDSFNNLNEPGK